MKSPGLGMDVPGCLWLGLGWCTNMYKLDAKLANSTSNRNPQLPPGQRQGHMVGNRHSAFRKALLKEYGTAFELFEGPPGRPCRDSIHADTRQLSSRSDGRSAHQVGAPRQQVLHVTSIPSQHPFWIRFFARRCANLLLPHRSQSPHRVTTKPPSPRRTSARWAEPRPGEVEDGPQDGGKECGHM